MKNIIPTVFMLVFLMSCSKDDESENANEPAEIQRYPKTAEILIPNDSGDLVTFLKFTYGFNAERKVTSVLAEGFFGYENVFFSYGNNGLPNEIEVQNDQGIITYTLEYTDNRLSAYSYYGQNYDVNYNSTSNTYTITRNNFLSSYTINEMNDVRRYYSLNPNSSETVMQMTFDTAKKGFFYNVDIPLNFFTAIISDASSLLFTSHIPLSRLDTDSTFNYQNSYESDDFITESIVTGGQDVVTIQFEYQEL